MLWRSKPSLNAPPWAPSQDTLPSVLHVRPAQCLVTGSGRGPAPQGMAVRIQEQWHDVAAVHVHSGEGISEQVWCAVCAADPLLDALWVVALGACAACELRVDADLELTCTSERRH